MIPKAAIALTSIGGSTSIVGGLVLLAFPETGMQTLLDPSNLALPMTVVFTALGIAIGGAVKVTRWLTLEQTARARERRKHLRWRKRMTAELKRVCEHADLSHILVDQMLEEIAEDEEDEKEHRHE